MPWALRAQSAWALGNRLLITVFAARSFYPRSYFPVCDAKILNWKLTPAAIASLLEILIRTNTFFVIKNRNPSRVKKCKRF